MPDDAAGVFRDACGLKAPLTLEVRDPRTNGAYLPHRVHLPFALVGRDPRAELVLEDADVSRRHAFLQAVGGRILCLDLHSRTRLRFEGESGHRDRGWLAPGRDLWIGPYALRLAGPDLLALSQVKVAAPPESLGLDAADSRKLPQAGLALHVRKDNQESLWSITTRVALVGRSEACHLVLGHESVSRFHATLIRTPLGVWIVDLLAREGVSVNGQRVQWAWLEDGDTVRIGRYTFVLRYTAPPAQISREDVPLEAGARRDSSRRIGSPGQGTRARDRGTGLAIRSRKSVPAFVKPFTTPAALTPEVMEGDSPAKWELGAAAASQQMAMWQQQMRMMETFHDDMMLMIQMFMAMHREHLGAVKDELDKVRELSKELGLLQGKLAEPTRASGATSLEQGAVHPAAEGLRKGARGNGQGQAENAVDAPVTRFVKTPLSESAGPTPLPEPAVPVASGAAAAKERSEARSSLGEQSQFHLDITRRITELQRERQGYWQRILSAINKQAN